MRSALFCRAANILCNCLLRTEDLASSANPIPGEADKALVSYAVAFSRSKERDDRSPDPNWIAVYATEKQSILARITPRQEQDVEFAFGLFDDLYY